MLENGAPVDATTNFGNTAMFFAARTGRSKIVEVLIAKGGSVKVKNGGGDSALLWAASGASHLHPPGTDPSDFVSVVHKLLASGLSVDDTNHKGLNVLHCAVEAFPLLQAVVSSSMDSPSLKPHLLNAINQKSNAGETPLHFAALDGANKVCELFLSLGADPFITSQAGNRPLACAKDATCIALLKKAEANVQTSLLKAQQDLLDELEADKPTAKSTSKTFKKQKKPFASASHKEKTTTEKSTTSTASPSAANQPSLVPTTSSGPRIIKLSEDDADQTQQKDAGTAANLESTLVANTPVVATSWASIATKQYTQNKSSIVTAPFRLDRVEISDGKSAEQVAAAHDSLPIPPSLTSAPISSNEPEVLETLEERLLRMHPVAGALNLTPSHFFDANLEDLSMEQLDALEEIHKKELETILAAKLDLVRRRERDWFEEELSRRLDIERRILLDRFSRGDL